MKFFIGGNQTMNSKKETYVLEDLVLFKIRQKKKIGLIYDVHYLKDFNKYLFDIFVEDENTIYKFIKDEEIVGRLNN